MNKILLMFFMLSFNINCNSQENTQIVNTFFQSYNDKDSITHFNCLHQDYVQTWESEQITIKSKISYADNYSWGATMIDKEEFEIIGSTDSTIVISSVYYCLRDKFLNLGPYKCIKTFYIREGKIVQIDEKRTKSYEKHMKPRNEAYDFFFESVGRRRTDFPFNKLGAEALKKLLQNYKQ